MNSSAATAPSPGVLPAPPAERVHVSSKWRAGQIVVTVLILLLAVYYNTIGYKSPIGETGLADKVTLFDQIGFLLLIALTWLTTPAAGVIATTTFQEAIRRRWMSALLAFALVMLALSTFFTWMQPGEEEKFLRDFGMGFIIIITLLMAIFLGVALVPPEIERRTIFTILSKPVDRLEFLIGKFLGLSLTLLINLFFLSVMFLASYAIFKLRREGYAGAMEIIPQTHPGLAFDLLNMGRALMLHFGQLVIMAALALMLSLIVSNITAIVFCFVVYFGGQGASFLEHLGGDHAGDEKGLSGPVLGLVKTMGFILPRLDRFDVRERLVNDMPVAFNYIWKAFGSGLIYVAVLLTIAYLIFSDREF
jgi:ABC-type transport system involved in multi-copper enzyme maturation permease subunit